jgi:hypothetical protein
MLIDEEELLMYWITIIAGIISGTITGAITGGSMLGIPTYFDNSTGFLGPARSWAPIMFCIGAIAGSIPGAVIGLAIGLMDSSSYLVGLITGSLVGFIITILLFGKGAAGDGIVTLWALLSIPAGGLVGIVVMACMKLIDYIKS